MTTHLVLADSNPTIHQVVQLCFRDEPVDVICFSDGRDALEFITQRPADLLLADVSLPGLDGYSLCHQVKRNPQTAHIPVVLLAGAFVSLDRQRLDGSGAHSVLQKPLGTAQLAELIGEVLSGPADPPPEADQPEGSPGIDLQMPDSVAEGLREDLFELDSRDWFSPAPVYRCRLVRGNQWSGRERIRPSEDPGPADPAERLVRELTDRLQAELPRFVSEAARSLRQRSKS